MCGGRERGVYDGPSKYAYMGPPYGSAAGLRMGLIWVISYAGCPDGSHMGPT